MSDLASASLSRGGRAILGCVSVAFAGAVGPTVSTAQRPPISIPVVPTVGSHVRVASPYFDHTVEGRIDEVRGDTMLIRSSGPSSPIVLRAADATRIEVYRRGRDAEEAATVGAVVGALTGTAIWAKWCHDDPEGCARDAEPRCVDYTCTDTTQFTVAILSIVGGAVVGGLAAYALTPPRWEVLGAPARLGLAPARRGGIRVGLALSFFARPGRSALRR